MNNISRNMPESSSNRRRPQSLSPSSSSSSVIARAPSSPSTPSTLSLSSYSSMHLAAPSSPPSVVSFTSRMQIDKLQNSQGIPPTVSSLPGLRILGAVVGIVGFPLALYGFHIFPGSSVLGSLLWQIRNVWSALLRMDMLYLAFVSLCLSVYLGGHCNLNGFSTAALAAASTPLSSGKTTGSYTHEPQMQQQPPLEGCLLLGKDPQCVRWGRRISRASGGTISRSTAQTCLKKLRLGLMTVEGLTLCLVLIALFGEITTKSFPLLVPSWIYYPAALFSYKVYPTSELVSALQGMCPDSTDQERSLWEDPLCLSEDSWLMLSSGKISSKNYHDVRTVYRGIDYARHESGGLVISVLARDIKHHIPAFKDNVEALSHFFRDLAVVVFENDSSDGSRQALKEWVADSQHNNKGYQIDLLDCEEAQDCKFGNEHRDKDRGDFYLSKAVGDMDKYRNRVKDYIIDSPKYQDFSHMLVTDIDLSISLSPLGIVHSLGGQYRDNAVATSGRFLLVDAFGTISIPYDMSAFIPQSSELNHFTLSLHEQWCAMSPPEHRWTNICDASSAMKLSEMMRVDQGKDGDFYEVESAFNGAVLYPIPLVKDSGSSYDAGEYGQRCEHIGFNLGLRKPMFVSRKWEMHLDPRNPGGPTGWRAETVFRYVQSTPRLIIPVVTFAAFWLYVFCHCFITLGVFLVYPLLAPLAIGAKNWRLMVASPRRRRRLFLSQASTAEGSAAEETLLKIV